MYQGRSAVFRSARSSIRPTIVVTQRDIRMEWLRGVRREPIWDVMGKSPAGRICVRRLIRTEGENRRATPLLIQEGWRAERRGGYPRNPNSDGEVIPETRILKSQSAPPRR